MAEKTTRREKGTGNIYQRKNGTWVGRITEGLTHEGKPKIKYFSGKSENDVKRKIREYNKSGEKIDTKKISVETYLLNWLKTYKKNSLKASSYDRLEVTAMNQIIPNIGTIQLQQLTPDDIQDLLSKLISDGYSHSTIKKSYDCLNALLTHASIRDDIVKNPMLLVKMPDKNQFTQKSIRFFSKREAELIIEECNRKYKTGRFVYPYGSAYILMLNTGLRMGEMIGLKKSDWNREEKTLHIQRNIQSVNRRDKNGVRLTGRELISNTTKTYSGDRIIPLNNNAIDALNKLSEINPDNEYIASTSKGGVIPPERLQRGFYRILKNIGLEKVGTHSLRHTFASFLFSERVDIKTISKLLGHASVQITLNTYVHLINNPDQAAVAKLDNIF